MNEVAEKTTLTDAETLATLKLLSDGAEFDKVRNCLLVWFHRNYDVIFTQAQNGWASKNNHIPDTYQFHRSFHEMPQVLLDTYVTPTPQQLSARNSEHGFTLS